jgi:3-oxoacyl-[acyl-carrier protein] reductase
MTTPDMFRLDDKVAIVTGASSGLGVAFAKGLAEAGADVVLGARRADRLEETAQLVRDAGRRVLTVQTDVADPAQCQALVDAAMAELGHVDVLVNNAGVAVNGMLMRFTDDQWKKVLDTNLAGAFHCLRAASMLILKAKDAGRIINITSVVGESGNGGQVAYAASKAGLIGLTMSTAKELASRGVTCNAVSPGFIETDMTAEHLPEAARAKLMEQIPLGRIGRSEDVADAVAFLAGPEAGYITGQVLRVNGGMLM